ncbi:MULTISPECIES: hypothetical protein [Bradyrhizobium]|uniref:BA14K family protein n=2 Tax=Bradyrhizobium TaxID=374 RepID=A0ABY0QDJ2_9BRAD|nr:MULTISPECIES: hypothetical protein [Bradyrhizobium]SDJ97427.1 hypothetical protein SAMN05444163_6898 [Bradyrhizobium ottawaense]SEB93161.1 hypothetical protein SAMN05444171_0259 [Bradyrhizobium lablabi]SHM63856.1 hypothetical protein SAMN05444321_7038 [Bradyrhizobium lablabi]
MSRKTLLTLSVSVTLATISLAPTAVFAQFPGPPPMGPGGPPPIAAGGPPAFASPPPMGPGGAGHAGLGGPAPRLGPRGDLRALGGVRAGGRDGPTVARSVQARSALVSDSRSGSFSHGYGGRRYGYGAAAYAAGAYAGYAYGNSSGDNYSDSDCYYAYRHHQRVLVCN